MHKRVRLTEDPMCKAKPETRFAIGKNSPLRYKGLFKKEQAIIDEYPEGRLATRMAKLSKS